MEVEQSNNIGDTGGGNRNNNGGGDVTVTCTSLSVTEQVISADDEDFELPETTYRSRHAQLLSALGADVGNESEDFGDIQFFHHPGSQFTNHHHHQQYQFQAGGSYLKGTNDDEDYDVIDVSNLTITSGSHKQANSATNSSENPFVFPDNVMEYGEPQFFPGNCVGYLETILEETDEEYEEEEGCSGRHWWTADSDTDTDSVIRVDNNGKGGTVFTNPFAFKAENAAAANNTVKNNNGTAPPTFRTSASSKPFELEDLQLLDQLDLAFEETFLQQTGRLAGFGGNSEDIFAAFNPEKKNGTTEGQTTVITTTADSNESNNKKPVPQFADDVQPAEVNEEDFFYSSSEESEEVEEDSEAHSEEASSSDDGKNDGVVLAEFSLNSSFTSATASNRLNRRSFEGSNLCGNSNSKLRSFRSFDSLNCLAGTELLFSKGDFPSFQYIKEEEPSGEGGGGGTGGGGGVGGGSSSSNSSCRDRKNSDSSAEQMSGDRGSGEMMSTENLSEDSGIGGDGSALNLNAPHGGIPQPSASNSLTSNSSSSANDGPNSLGSYIPKSEFALNPFVYSSAESSMNCSLPTQQQSIITTTTSSLVEGSVSMSATNQAEINQTRSSTTDDDEEEESSSSGHDQNIIIRDEECGRRNSEEDDATGESSSITVQDLQAKEEMMIIQEEKKSEEESSSSSSSSSSSPVWLMEPDIVAQCNINATSQATTAETLMMGKPCEEESKEFQGLPGLASVQQQEEGEEEMKKTKYKLDYKLNTLDLPPPNSEVLLKFTDEDEIIYSSESHHDDNLMEEEEEEDTPLGAKRNEQFVIPLDCYGSEVTAIREGMTMSVAEEESGPMPAFNEATQTGFYSAAAAAAASTSGGLPLNNNSVSSSSSSHLAPTTTTTTTAPSIDENADPWLERRGVSESVRVQKSNWTDQCGGGATSDSGNNGEVGFESKFSPEEQEEEQELKHTHDSDNNDISSGGPHNLISDTYFGGTLSEPSVVPVNVPDILSLAEMELATKEARRSLSPPPPQQQQQPVKTKTYGPRNEVEVVLISSRTPSPIIKIDNNSSTSEATTPTSPVGEHGKKKEVHFCPVVSEISWRESYIEGSENNSESSDNILDGPGASVDDDDDGDYEDEEGMECNNEIRKSVVTVQEQVIAQPAQAVPLVTSPTENNAHPHTNGHVYEDVGNPSPVASSNQRNNAAAEEQQKIPQQQQHPQSTLSIVPDLLSQCNENVPQTHTHITVNIETKPIQEPQQQRPQQQIFPSIFAEKNDALKIGVKSKNKGAKSSSIKGTTATSPPAKPQDEGGKETKPSKPGFFERLTKIRLSGSKSKNNKKKVHPKEKENIQKLGEGAAVTANTTQASKKSPSPILKSSTLPPNTTTTTATRYGTADEEIMARSHEQAFENILEDIAGINSIKSRQRQQSVSPIPSSNRSSVSPEQKTRRFAERKQFLSSPEQQQRSASVGRSPLDTKLSQFKEEASRERDQLSKSHPDLETIQGVVRDSIAVTIEDSKTTQSSPRHLSNTLPKSSPERSSSRARSPEKTEREWYKLLKTAAEKYYYRGSGGDKAAKGSKTGIVETDLDTGASREMLDLDSELVEKVPTYSTTTSSTAKTRSLTNLTTKPHLSLPPQQDQLLLSPGDLSDSEERAKSLEFLLDGNNQKLSVPPENKLQQESRQLSEHELRIQRSLQKLNVPEWYKKNAPSTTTTHTSSVLKPADAKLNKRSEFGSASGLAGGWTGLSTYKTSSLTSLQNSRYTGTINRNFVRGRPVTMSVNRTSRESLLSPSSTASQSPSAFERCSFTYGMPFTLTRFGHGRLSSTGSASVSPPSTPVNPIGPTYTKKPYLGWRSQERLNNGTTAASPTGQGGLKLSLYRPPEERLAAEILNSRHRSKSTDRPPLPKPPPRDERTVLTNRNGHHSSQESPTGAVGPTVHDSIREVTEQINQLVNRGDYVAFETENEPPPKPKPRQQKSKRPNIWIESSFVGTKPAATANTTH